MSGSPRFADRREELALLRRLEGRRGGQLLVVHGRRRVGKTALLARHLQTSRRRSIYLYIDLLKRDDLLDQLSRDVARQLQAPVAFRRWEDLWDYVDASVGRGLTVVLDEFQRLRTVSPDALSSLQRAWDERLRRRPILLVLMGSAVGMVRRLAVDARGALYGRSTAILPLHPFTYAQARTLLRGAEPRRVELYAAFGGTPHYLSLALATPGDLWRKIRELVLEPYAPLREEPLNVLAAELRDPEKYHSILRAIAGGRGTPKEIGDVSGVAPTRLPYYLGALEDLLEVVRREEPVLGAKRSGRYVIQDPFFRFWFRFVHRQRGRLELGDVLGVLRAVREEFPAHAGTIFEGIVREWVAGNPRLGGRRLEVERVGAWWDRRGHEIDVCAPLRDGSVLLGEVTWRSKPVGAADVDALLKKADLVAPQRPKRFLLVGRKVDPQAREALGGRGAVLDLADLAGTLQDTR